MQMNLSLPVASDLNDIRARIAKRSDLGVSGSMWLGEDTHATNILIINCLTYEGEKIPLGPIGFLMRNRGIIRPGWRVGAVLARPELREETSNLNRIDGDMAPWEAARLDELSTLSVFDAEMFNTFTIDLQANRQPQGLGWMLDMRGLTSNLDRFSSKVACPFRICKLPGEQQRVLKSDPIGTRLPGVVTEILMQPEDADGAILNATLVVLSALAGLGAIEGPFVEVEEEQRVYNVVGSVTRDARLGYTVASEDLLKPFARARAGIEIARASNGTGIVFKEDCQLVLGPSQLEVEAGSSDPLWYKVVAAESVSRVKKLPTWAAQLS